MITDDDPQRKGGTFVIETIKHEFSQTTSNRCNGRITYKCVSFLLYVHVVFSLLKRFLFFVVFVFFLFFSFLALFWIQFGR